MMIRMRPGESESDPLILNLTRSDTASFERELRSKLSAALPIVGDSEGPRNIRSNSGKT
jgi:hypothetical protein